MATGHGEHAKHETHSKHEEPAKHAENAGHATKGHYGRLGIMTALSFVAMYFLMYAMVDATGNVFMNVNQAYMAGLMAAPMVLIELALMGGMYRDERRNMIIASAAVVGAILCFVLIRKQTAVGDRQFLRSMIPHHSAAILMCNEAPIEDAEIRALCQNIVSGQQAEIDQMKAKLKALAN